MRRWTHPRTTTLPAGLMIIVKSVAELHGALMTVSLPQCNIIILITRIMSCESRVHDTVHRVCVHPSAGTHAPSIIYYYYVRPPPSDLRNKFAYRFKTPRRKEHTRWQRAAARVCSLLMNIFYKSSSFFLLAHLGEKWYIFVVVLERNKSFKVQQTSSCDDYKYNNIIFYILYGSAHELI